MNSPVILVKDVTIAYGDRIILHDINFEINKGDIFVIMGSSGCGKSSLLRALMGLLSPAHGDIFLYGENFWEQSLEQQTELMKKTGVLFQSGALWSSRTLGENIALPLEYHTGLSAKRIQDLVSYKLELVGLQGFEDYYPAELSGGMQKRAGLARALALDPEIVFFDEPSTGLDPINSAMLDDLILQLKESLGMTLVIVSHELASIFDVTTTSIYLDIEEKTILARGLPSDLLSNGPSIVQSFLKRKMPTKDELSDKEQVGV